MDPWRNRITRYSEEDPAALVPNEKNFRRHPEAQAAALVGVLGDVGLVQGVLANERTGRLIDGHLRVAEAIKARQPSIPVTWVDLAEDEERLILATLDPLGALATTDAAALDALLREVSTDSPAVAAMLAELAEGAGVVAGIEPGQGGDDFDATPDEGETRCKAGDLWIIGGVHRLIVGDCTDPATVARLMQGERADVLVYDPPWDNAVAVNALPVVIAFSDGRRIGDVLRHLGSPTWLFTWDCVSSWYTPNRPLQRAKYAAWYGDITTYQFDGAHYGDAGEPRTVWNTRGEYQFVPDSRGKHLADVFSAPITQLHSNNEHPHEKPIDWVRMLVGNCTPDTALIYDPFLGSGTTLIAAHRTGRRCYGCEIAPAYGDVILRRAEAEGLTVERI